ncbi:replication initiation protein [Fusobacterium nucleatum]|uniref:replication initiation protein n=1 Tax=Fusobacterium nucleatum TaxID=851 RepID=UPI0030CD366F
MKKIIDLIEDSSLFDIKIEYTKKFSKNDIYFKQFLIKKIIKTNEKIFYLTEKEAKKILIFPHGENFDIFLKKFCSKRLIIKYRKSEEEYYELILNIISSILKNNNTYVLKVSEDFYKIFNSEKNDFKFYQLNIFLGFSNIITRKLFNLIKNIYNELSIEISLDNLRRYLNLEESYERFFDFEKKILIPSLKEIENFTSYKILYSKIKNSISTNARVKAIRFNIIQNSDDKSENEISILYKLVKPFAQNLFTLQKFISYQANFYSYQYLKKNIEYSLLHSKNNLDSFLVEAIKYDWVNTKFKEKLQKYSKKYSLIFKLSKKVITVEEFRKVILKNIEKNELDKELSLILNFMRISARIFENNIYKDNNLLKNKVYLTFYKNLQEANECIFQDEKTIILAEFNQNCSNSNLAIFKK